MKINVIGLGYIGLPTALMFAANSVQVVGTDYNEKIIESLKNGEVTFKENGLSELFDLAVENGIEFTTKYISTDIYIISVPTPYNAESKKIDATYVVNAVESVLRVCPKGAILVIESTVSPGTMDKHIRPVVEKHGFNIGVDIHLAHAPERILPGNMIYELKNNSRTIGADNVEISEKIRLLYKSFCNAEIAVTDIRTAEMSKVVENTYRDINIAFANELMRICRSDGLDIYEIIRIANMHPRVNILQPGPGVGGHCISVDPWFLVGDYPSLTNLIGQARKINDSQPDFVLSRIYEIMKENNIKDVTKVGLYGLTYKENVDDVRESPTLQMIESMNKHLASGIKIYDPYIKECIVENQVFDFNEFLELTEMVVIMVNHDEIKNNLNKLNGKIVLDTKNIMKGAYKL